MYKVYVLRSLSGQGRYVGSSSDFEKRFLDHNSGKSRYTKNRGPWKTIYTEEYSSRGEAIRRERFLKSGKGREFLDSLKE